MRTFMLDYNRNVTWLVWLSVLLLADPRPTTAQTRLRPEKGTLIVFAKTQEGILVCADKRLTYGPNKYRDDFTKLTQIGANIVFAVGGVPHIEVTDGRGSGYDAVKVVKDHFAAVKFDNSEPFWNGLKKKLVDNFVAYLRVRKYDDWPPTLFPEAEHSFTQIVFVFADDSYRLRLQLVRLRYMKQQPPVIVAQSFDVEPKGIYDSLGWSKLDIELKRGHDSRFEDLRQESVLKPFLTNELPVAKVTIDMALSFIKRLIEVSNKRGPELGEASEDIGIGLTCDCILVTEMSGVRWIAQNLKIEQ
jgi:hypothetical protein